MTQRIRFTGWIGLCVSGAAVLGHAGDASAQTPEWELVRPSTTGIPGESVRFATFGPEGRMWVSARWPFWGEGGLGIYDFDTQIWTTLGNVNTPVPSQWVNDVAFAADGAVWIATSGGLVKKDGDQWTVYNTANSPLLHNSIRSIELDSAGRIWVNNSGVQTGNAALFMFDGTNWTSFAVPNELPWADPWRQLSGLLVDRNDHVWVANEVLSGVAEYDGERWTLHGANVNRFGSITEDLAGNLWLIAGLGGGNAFYLFNGTSFTTFTPANTPFVNTTITTASVDADGAVYIGNWGGQVIKTTDEGESWSLFTTQNASIFSIAPSPAGDVWVTTPGAARHLTDNGVWLEAFNTYNTGMPDYFIDRMVRDSAGNMWFVSGEAGVSRFDGERWFNLGSHNPNQPWPVLADGADSVLEDSEGNIWIGTNGVAKWDGDSLTLWDWSNSNLGVIFTPAIAQDGDGTIWIGTEYSGLFWFDGVDWVHHNVGPPNTTANWVRDLATDSQGNLWVSTQVALHRFDGQTWTNYDHTNSPLFDLGGPGQLAFGPDGRLWIGAGEGLVAFDGETWTVYDTFNSPLPAETVAGIDFREDGLMAVSCLEFGPTTPFPNGVAVIDGDIDNPDNWTIHTFENSPLPHYQLGRVAFDATDSLWISAISEAVAVVTVGAIVVSGDGDGDGDVDLVDFAAFLDCVSGPGGGTSSPCTPFDFDADGDVDWTDAASFQIAFAGF